MSLPDSSVPSPGRVAGGVQCPFKNFIIAYCSPEGLLNAKPLQLSKLGDLGARASGDSRKSWITGCVVQTLHSLGKSWGNKFPPDYTVLSWGWGLWRIYLNLSYLFQHKNFLIFLIRWSHFTTFSLSPFSFLSFFVSEGIV